jgi:hypothetical protein
MKSILLPTIHMPARIYPLPFTQHEDLSDAAGMEQSAKGKEQSLQVSLLVRAAQYPGRLCRLATATIRISDSKYLVNDTVGKPMRPAPSSILSVRMPLFEIV